MIEPKKAVSQMEAYSAPKEGRRKMLALDFNENINSCSEEVIKALSKINPKDISMYPEYNPFLENLSKGLNICKENLLLTNGADEAIRLVMETYVDKGDEIILPVPTFSLFKQYASLFEGNIKEIKYEDDLSFPKKLIDQITSKTRLIPIVSPNNPLGSVIEEDFLIKLLIKSKKTLVVLDEVYSSFNRKSYINLIEKYPNLLVMKSFSKDYGLAGLRIGYIVANSKLIKDLKKVASPYSVSQLSLICAEAALKDKTFLSNYITEIEEGKIYLKKKLENLGFKVYPSSANFLLVDFEDKTKIFVKKLREKGILVRDRSKEISGTIRITIGNKQIMKSLIETIKQIKSEIKDIDKSVLLFDMDGVIVDVNNSYRRAIKLTTEFFIDKEIKYEDIQRLKNEGGFNNDWLLTYELIKRNKVQIDFEEVKEKFQEIYLGKNFNGLINTENSLFQLKDIICLSKIFKMGIVTGRPKEEAYYFLEKQNLLKYFTTIITLDDVGSKTKPNPFGLLLALKKMNAKEGFYFGDTVDDMIASKKAGLIPIGVIPPYTLEKSIAKENLKKNGAKIILENFDNLKDKINNLKDEKF